MSRKSRGPGRPSQGLSERVEVRFTPEQLQALTTRARAKGMSLAGFIRLAVLEAGEDLPRVHEPGT